MKRILSVLFAIGWAYSLLGQPIGTQISLKHDQWKDTIVFLAQFKGNSHRVIDTIRLNSGGKGKLIGSFHPGQYSVVMPNRTTYSLIINEKRIKLSIADDKINYHGSDENMLFSEFMRLQTAIDKKQRSIAGGREPNVPLMLEKLNQDQSKRSIFRLRNDELIASTLAGKIIEAICRPHDLGYYAQHPEVVEANPTLFFKYLDITDPNMLYTQIFNQKIKFYLTQGLKNDADLLIPALTELLEKSKVNPETYQFLADYYLGFFQRSRFPEHELVFKYLVEEYCLNGQMPWVEPYQKERLKTQVEMLRNQLLGTTHGGLDVWTIDGLPYNYDTLKAEYKMVLFWDVDCGHCRKDVPDYYKVYKDFKERGFEVIAIYGESDKEGWVKFIRNKGLWWKNVADIDAKGNLKHAIILAETPTVLLLDKNNTVIKKRFTPTELRVFLREHLP